MNASLAWQARGVEVFLVSERDVDWENEERAKGVNGEAGEWEEIENEQAESGEDDFRSRA